MKNKNKKAIVAIPLSIAFIAAAAGFCVWQNNDIVISRYTYSSVQVPESFDGYKIVQVSDLHNKMFGDNEKRLIGVIRAEAPDMIVLTGDLIDSRRTDIEAALVFAREAVKLAPVFYITGNHEKRLSEEKYAELIGGLERLGVKVLNSELYTVESGKGESFDLIGLDDGDLRNFALRNIVKKTDQARLQILLAHEPQYAVLYAGCGVDLVLSGHAHGGQVRLPLIGGLYAPGQGVFPEYTAGLYAISDTVMVVSRGLGNSGFPARVFNRPEVVTVTLSKG